LESPFFSSVAVINQTSSLVGTLGSNYFLATRPASIAINGMIEDQLVNPKLLKHHVFRILSSFFGSYIEMLTKIHPVFEYSYISFDLERDSFHLLL
jgi:hypothetical protein